jgi:hypothetical protein
MTTETEPVAETLTQTRTIEIYSVYAGVVVTQFIHICLEITHSGLRINYWEDYDTMCAKYSLLMKNEV